MPEPSAPFPPLDIAQVRRALADSRFADVRYVAETGSTNDDAAPLLGEPARLGITIVAESQTAGKGRRPGRQWIATQGSALLFTTVLPAELRASDLWAVPFWVALCVADGVSRAAGISLDLRWPNDGFVGERKAAGILCFSRVSAERALVGCGVGVNVFRPAAAMIAAIEPPPAFLSDVAPRVSRENVFAEILLAFERRLPGLRAPDEIARAYEERAGLPGSRYRVRYDRDGSEREGTALGIGSDGALRLAVNGVEERVALGDARRL